MEDRIRFSPGESGEGRLSRVPPADAGCPAQECPPSDWGLYGYPLASVYVPVQDFDGLYDCHAALARGTLFRELDKPFWGKLCSVCAPDGEPDAAKSPRRNGRGFCRAHSVGIS